MFLIYFFIIAKKEINKKQFKAYSLFPFFRSTYFLLTIYGKIYSGVNSLNCSYSIVMSTLRRVGAYDGVSDTETFVQDFKLQSIYQDWDDAKQLEHFPMFLKNKAKRVSDALSEADKTDLKKVYSGVIKGCKPPNESLLHNFNNPRKKPEEYLSVFANSLQELLLLAMPDLTEKYRDTLLRAQLCLSLPDDLKQLVNFTADALTWDQL